MSQFDELDKKAQTIARQVGEGRRDPKATAPTGEIEFDIPDELTLLLSMSHAWLFCNGFGPLVPGPGNDYVFENRGKRLKLTGHRIYKRDVLVVAFPAEGWMWAYQNGKWESVGKKYT